MLTYPICGLLLGAARWEVLNHLPPLLQLGNINFHDLPSLCSMQPAASPSSGASSGFTSSMTFQRSIIGQEGLENTSHGQDY